MKAQGIQRSRLSNTELKQWKLKKLLPSPIRVHIYKQSLKKDLKLEIDERFVKFMKEKPFKCSFPLNPFFTPFHDIFTSILNFTRRILPKVNLFERQFNDLRPETL